MACSPPTNLVIDILQTKGETADGKRCFLAKLRKPWATKVIFWDAAYVLQHVEAEEYIIIRGKPFQKSPLHWEVV